MQEEVYFFSALLLTVVFLGGAAITGFKRRRSLHLTLVGLSVVGLGASIYFALQLGEVYDLDAAGWITPVHLALAKVATFLYVWPAVTGVLTLRDDKWRRSHRVAALSVFTLTVLATITGAWMLLAAERIA
ncbi:MAG: hypothetical protein ACYS26_17475 [Planctomycetota bacterium]|jgi:hypothetical protein